MTRPRLLVVAGLTLAVAAAAATGLLQGWVLTIAILALGGVALMLGRPAGPANVTAPPPAHPDEGAAAENILAQLPEPVIVVGDDLRIGSANAPAQALLPRLKAGEPLSFAVRSPDLLDGVSQVLRGGPGLRVDYVERVPQERAFEMRIEPLVLEGDRLFALVLFHEVSAARRLEQMRVDFVANASHELRTPLASVLGFIETLQGPARNDPAARERFLGIMRTQAERMRRLVDDLLSLSRIEQREHLAPTTPIDLALLGREIVGLLDKSARARGVEITFEAPGKSVPVLGDRDELLRLSENLIENAVKYGESGARVEVTVSQSERWAELSVRDHGPGIAPEHLPRLTERFYRADIAESREKGGTGLGLAIVKHIVSRHRGTLHIDSTPGQGALFRVRLPRA